MTHPSASAISTARATADATDHARIKQEFTYHSPHDDQPARYQILRDKARELAHLVVNLVPPCADRTAAIRKLRECVFTANAAIAIQESLPAAQPVAPVENEATTARIADATKQAATHPRAGGPPQPGGMPAAQPSGPREL